jgi:type III secretion protein D
MSRADMGNGTHDRPQAPPEDMTAPCELRVLAGPQAGAGVPLTPGATIDVGSLSAGDCQLVLRDPRVNEQRIRLRVDRQAIRIEVLAGTVDMAGQMLTAPITADWPPFMPLRMGDTVMSVGTPHSAQWAEVMVVAAAAPRAGLDAHADLSTTLSSPGAPAPADGAASASEPAASGRRKPEAWLAMIGGLVTVAAAGLLVFSSALTNARAAPETLLQRLQGQLRAPAFLGLHIDQIALDRFSIRGQVLTTADRARLDRLLTEAGVTAEVDIEVGDQIADAVRDVYRMNGVAADVSPPARLADVGMVHLRTASADLPRLALIEATAKHDVRGLKLLHVENALPQRAPDATPVSDDPGKRIASVVPGEAPYIVTADGTRYFTGALLPSGHRIDAINDTELLLEKDGKTHPLKF